MQESVEDLFKRCENILSDKGNDYSHDNDRHSCFKYAANVANIFDMVYRPYVVLIGIKLARIANLMNGKKPACEAIEDSFIDLINYCGLMAERYLTEKEKNV